MMTIYNKSRGLTLLELLLAISITALVAAAIAAMLGAVSSGVGTRRDNRTVMVLSNAADARLSAYIAPSRCVLATDKSGITLWFNDTRESQTVHASEIRWLSFDPNAGTLSVHYVRFPDNWTQATCDVVDKEYPANTNWSSVLTAFRANGWIHDRTLIDGLASMTIRTDSANVADCRHVNIELGFVTTGVGGLTPITVAGTIRQHEVPAS